MRLQFIGSGDAFGSGGRFNTCFHVIGAQANFLIDCGASSLIALKAKKVALNSIRTIFITHFHADHFGGIPFFILDAQFFSKRSTPLTIAGPQGLEEWYERVMETAFPGSSKTRQPFDLSLVDLKPKRAVTVNGIVGLVLTSAIWLKRLFLDICVVLPDSPFFPRATGTNQYV